MPVDEDGHRHIRGASRTFSTSCVMTSGLPTTSRRIFGESVPTSIRLLPLMVSTVPHFPTQQLSFRGVASRRRAGRDPHDHNPPFAITAERDTLG